METEPLLQKLEALAPHFGRASDDLKAMVSRGRARDYKGVMQNARLVLEALLRDLVTRELKGTPGKAMLDELITKFRQQANQGVVPTNVLAHMGTVQAWGNLSAHDHAGSLTDDGVKVGEEEAVASLNSMVAILTWYAQKRGSTPAPGSASVVAAAASAVQQAAPAPKAGSKAPLFIGIGVAAVLGVVAVLALRTPEPAKPPLPTENGDAKYAQWGEPVPPPACRPAAEQAYLTARERFEAKQPVGEALDRALGCPEFAAALHLAGKVAALEANTDKALSLFDQAITLAPTFAKARFNRAAVLLKAGRVDDALADLKTVAAVTPTDRDAQFLLGYALEKSGSEAESKVAFCKAFDLGRADAKERCGR